MDILTLPIFVKGLGMLHPAVIRDQEHLVLVDCGINHSLPELQKTAAAKGVDLDRLTAVIVTHHDFDHIGSLADIKKAYPNVKVVALDAEAPYLSRKMKSPRIRRMGPIYFGLPEERRDKAIPFFDFVLGREAVEPDIVVEDREVLPWFGGLEMIATPGHVPGHMAVYVRAVKTLFVGDAMLYIGGKAQLSDPFFTEDRAEALRSVEKLRGYGAETIVYYHGGIVTGNVDRAFADILGSYSECT